MIGGTVIKVIVLPDRVWINCEEDSSQSQCAIYVERNSKSELISPGDSVWWQGLDAMWTPFKMRGSINGADGIDYDIRIKRIGYSGVKQPQPVIG